MTSRVAGKKSASNRLSAKQRTSEFRVGRVLAHQRGQVWYLRYSENGQRQRPRVGFDREQARRMAAEINAQLESGAPSLLGFEPTQASSSSWKRAAHFSTMRPGSATSRPMPKIRSG